eukprot:1689118-Lingulodinium_polyedra.AAC.1
MLLLHMGSRAQQTIVHRDEEVLTPSDLATRAQEVRQAMLRELQTWAKSRSFSRRPRCRAYNPTDVQWVIKRGKRTNSLNHGPDSATVAGDRACPIQARLTIRGFKDSRH